MIHTLLRSAAPQRAVLTLALFLCASILAHAATWYVRTDGDDTDDGTSTATAFLTIQKAINSAANGDVIDVGAGTFAPTTTLAVNKEVRITGQGEGTTIIDVGGYNTWGIYITANNVTIEDLTVDGDATTNLQFCVKIGTGGPAGAGKSVAEDFTLEDVTIQNTWRTALDLNGVDGAAITRVTCQNVGNGFGMSISSSHNVTITDLTTSNCAWGDAGIFPANTAFQWNTALDGPDNIVFAGTLTLGAGSISVQDKELSNSRGTWVGTISNDAADGANVTVPASFTHIVNATRSDGLVFHNVGTEANIVTLAQGLAVATGTFTYSNISVRDMANDEWDVPSGLKIQAAIDAATAGDVVNVSAGTYAERLYISKELALRGANYGVAGNGVRGPESIIEIPAGTGVNDVYLIYADVDNITVDGFDLRIPDAFVDTYSMLWASAGLNNLTIRNNRMYGGVLPIYIYPGAPAKSGLLIERNYIDGGPCVNSLYGRGMYITNTAGIIQDNILTNVNVGIQYMPYENDQAGIIRRNTVEAALIGLYHNYQNLGAEDVLWEDNSVTVAPNDRQGLKAQVFGPLTTPVIFRGIEVITHGIQGTGDAPSVTFQNNDINCALDPLEIYNATVLEGFRISNGVSGTVTLENNSFVGYTTAVSYRSDCPTSCGATVTATCNWWGSADAATIASKISGNVDVTPFLSSVDPGDYTNPGFTPSGACDGTGPVLVYSDVAESTLVDTYFSIQSAIDAASTQDGYVVRVSAGTYAEQLTVSKELTLRGPNASIAGNGSRAAEAIIEFPTSPANGSSLITVNSNVHNVTIEGFDLRCQDATLPNYLYLIAATESSSSDPTEKWNNMTIRNNRMYSSEIPIYILTDVDAHGSDLLIEGNYINGGPNVNSWYNRGIYVGGTSGTIQDNVVENCNIAIQYMPYGNPNTGLISGNTVTAALIGLYHNYQNLGAEDVLWEDNSVTVAPNDQQGLKAQVFSPLTTPVIFRGIHVITHGIQGTGDAPSVTFQNNDINCALDPAETYNSTNREGFRISNGVSGTVTLENNSFVGYTTAVNYRSDCPTSCGATVAATCNWWGTASATAIASSIGSNASFLPFLSSVAPGDYTNPGFTPSGDCDGLGPVTSDDPVASYMTIQAAIDAANSGATITASAGTYTENVNLNKVVTLTGTGATIAGTTTISNANAVLTNMTLNGSPALTFSSGIGSYTLGASNTFDAACTTYVQLTNASTNVTLPGTTVLGGTTLSTLSPNAAENYAIEDKINHGMDVVGGYAGLVRWNGNRLYVTANTGTIQHAIDVASTSDAIYIDNITVNENPILYKDIVLNSRSSGARRLGTNNYFVFGTTSLGSGNLIGFNSGDKDKIGVNTNGTVSDAIEAVNISGTALLTTEVQTGGSASAEFDAFTITNKAVTVEGNGTTGANCDVAPVISIASVSGPALTSEGDANRSLKNVTLKLGASGSTFVRVTNGSIGDISVQDVRFQRGSEFITGLQPLTTPAALNDGKDIPEFLQDGADVGFGPGKVLFGQGAPFNATNVVAAWKGNDANSNSVQTLYSYSSTSLNLSQSFLTRRPSRSLNNTAFNTNTVIGIPTSGDRFLQALASSDVVSGNEKTIFIVFRTPSASTTDRVIYKHGDELNGISLIYTDAENVQFNIFNNRTGDASTFETFEEAVPTNTVAIAQLYFDGGSDNRRVGAALDWGTNDHMEAFANSTAFAATSLSAPAALNLTSAINVGALASGKTYFEGATQTRSTPGFTLKGGFIGEIIVLNTADAATRNDVYCYLHKKYNLGNNENGLERAIPVYDDEEIMAGAENTVWPNPATDVASVAFNVPESQFVTITLVDALGRPVANVASEYMMAGEQIFDITLENVPSGLYTVAINGFTFNTSAPVMVRK